MLPIHSFLCESVTYCPASLCAIPASPASLCDPCEPMRPLRASALRADALPGGDGGPALSRELQGFFGIIDCALQGVIIGE